jgi:glutamyl-Q tRNA(Asp) synthetase
MQDRESIGYVGRFAPSPTGPLHFGSLVAAVASFLQARVNNGRWLLRIEDIDPPREQPGATSQILKALECYGFEWDGETIFQSASADAHEEALSSLLVRDLAYRCSCSRKDLAGLPSGPLGVIYPGTCRNGTSAEQVAIRVKTDNSAIRFNDAIQGPFTHRLETESGDFVIRRRDKLIAYQLAVVVDDEIQGVTEIMRGIDLIDSTPRQIWLQTVLNFKVPHYAHIPVITHPNGDKLSKLTAAQAIPLERVKQVLVEALAALRQSPPEHLEDDSLAQIWSWATENWRIGNLKGLQQIVKTP